MESGNCIQGIEKFETKKTNKAEKNPKKYDKVLKAMGLSQEILDENK